jgi:hypothetical protein
MCADCRGKLAQVLHGVRYLARSRNPNDCEWMLKLRKKVCADKKKAPCTKASSSSSSSGGGQSFSSGGKRVNGRSQDEAQDGVKNEEEEEKDSSVLINFRELLWYWSEYYLRRGRDRLSLEFSTHVPFRHWQAVVGACSNMSAIYLVSKLIHLLFFLACGEYYRNTMPG